MPLSLLQSIVRTCVAAAKPVRRRRSAAGLKSREVSMGLESLEQRMALTVAVPSIRLTAASDTGVSKTDSYTNVANPVFTGVAPPRSTVSIFNGGELIGHTKASIRGVWSLRPQAALLDGPHTITGEAVLGVKPPIALRPLRMVIDTTPPTATSLTWNSGYGSQLTFSETVFGVQAANLRLAGTTEVGPLTSVSITHPRARALVGSVKMTRLENNTKFEFLEDRTLALPGTYTLSFVTTGVVDKAGNRLVANAYFHFTIA